MIDPANVPEVGPDEELARYILFSNHIRSDRTLKPDAFIPHPHLKLSVTRHLQATEEELWEVGDDVAKARSRPLYGRGDIGVPVCRAQRLVVRAEPIADNPNHAHVSDWPADKPAQKAIAQEIAAKPLFCRGVDYPCANSAIPGQFLHRRSCAGAGLIDRVNRDCMDADGLGQSMPHACRTRECLTGRDWARKLQKSKNASGPGGGLCSSVARVQVTQVRYAGDRRLPDRNPPQA